MQLLTGLFLLLLMSGPFAQALESVASFQKDQGDLKALVFLSSQCPCSRSHVAHLNKLTKEYPNLSLYGVITDELEDDELSEELVTYYSKGQFQFPIIKDSKRQLIKEHGALKTPHVTLMKKKDDGSFEVLYEGGISDHRVFEQSEKRFLLSNLEALRDQKPLPFREGRSLGCYIRRF